MAVDVRCSDEMVVVRDAMQIAWPIARWWESCVSGWDVGDWIGLEWRSEEAVPHGLVAWCCCGVGRGVVG